MPEASHQALRGLYAITPDGLAEEVLLARVEAALRGGARLLQYRDKQSTPSQRERMARGDLGRERVALCLEFDAREFGEATQAQLKDGLGLQLPERGHLHLRQLRGHRCPQWHRRYNHRL